MGVHIHTTIVTRHHNPNLLALSRSSSTLRGRSWSPRAARSCLGALQGALLPYIARFALDPVPNIRFCVARALETLLPRLDSTGRLTIVKPILQTLAIDREVDVQYFALKAMAALG